MVKDKNGKEVKTGDVVELPNFEKGTVMKISKDWTSPVTGKVIPGTIIHVKAATARGIQEYSIDSSKVKIVNSRASTNPIVANALAAKNGK